MSRLLNVPKFHPSSRLMALVNGTSKSVGVSCNTYQLQDTIDSIADGQSWAYQVLAYQGAPSIDFSNLRPRDSKLGSGGLSSGAVSFMYPFDAVVSTMRREEKKNGAGLAALDYKHKDLQEFLAADFRGAYKMVYLPMHDTPEAEELLADKHLMKLLAKAYNEFKCFLVKRPLPVKGEQLLINLCTEVEIPHRGSCVLGAHSLSAYSSLGQFAEEFPLDFRKSAFEMLTYFDLAQAALKQSPLACTSPLNRQFGLGLFGLASTLGDFGITYKELGDTMTEAFDAANDDLSGAITVLRQKPDSPVVTFTRELLRGYAYAANGVQGYVRAAFCFQPTVSTARRASDTRGYDVSPELQPVIGLKHESGVSTIVKSQLKSDHEITYSPKTWTIDEVPYADYAKVSNAFQRLLDSTGLGHRHSHCYYGSAFTTKVLERYYRQPDYKRIKSLYYRLPNQVNVDSLRKDKLWQETGELADFSLADFTSGSCQMSTDTLACDCAM